MSNQSKSTSKRAARERLAEERKRQAEAARRKERLVRGGVAAAVVIAIVLVVAVIQFTRDSQEVAFPPSATEESVGFVVGNTSDDSVPSVVVHEDFQCPNCELFESEGNGALLQQLADEDKIKLTYVVRTFLDNNLGNDASLRAANAAACADEQGQFLAYHNQVFANSPQTEGDGWTDEQLVGFGDAAGVGGDEFASCVEDKTFENYANFSERTSSAAGINSTPYLLINGEAPVSADPNRLADEFNDPAKLLATLGVEAPAGFDTSTPAPAEGATTATPAPTG